MLIIISGGVCSRLYICEDIGQSQSSNPKHVRKLLIRLFGGKVFDRETNPLRRLNDSEEAIIYFEQGRSGNGPHIYGIFKGGRVEQFIPSHTAKDADLANPEFIKEYAIKLARYVVDHGIHEFD